MAKVPPASLRLHSISTSPAAEAETANLFPNTSAKVLQSSVTDLAWVTCPFLNCVIISLARVAWREEGAENAGSVVSQREGKLLIPEERLIRANGPCGLEWLETTVDVTPSAALYRWDSKKWVRCGSGGKGAPEQGCDKCKEWEWKKASSTIHVEHTIRYHPLPDSFSSCDPQLS